MSSIAQREDAESKCLTQILAVSSDMVDLKAGSYDPFMAGMGGINYSPWSLVQHRQDVRAWVHRTGYPGL
jgi:hypothetical protein